nr:hypothetical protein [Elusimicrobiota bacterium]
MKTLKAMLGILTGLLLLPVLAAAAPSYINYQGRLVDASGNPLSGSYSITFNIYGVSSGGSAVWTEVQPSVSVDNGIFSAKLGSVTALPPSVFASDTRYLGVTIGSDAEMSPRVQLLSVPYAIYAASAASVGSAGQTVDISTGVNVTGNINASGNVIAAKFVGDGSALTGVSVGGSSIILPIVSTHIASGGVLNVNLGTGIDAAKIGGGTVSNTVFAYLANVTSDVQTQISGKLSPTGDGSNLTGIIHSSATGTYPLSITGNAANITGNLAAGQVAAGLLGPNVIASSVSPTALYTFSTCAAGDVLKASGGVWACGTDNTGAGGTVTGSGTTGQIAYWTAGSSLGTTDYIGARIMLGLVPGTSVQAYSANLATYSGIAPSANMQSFLGSADYATMRTNLSLVPGTNVLAPNGDGSGLNGVITSTAAIVATLATKYDNSNFVAGTNYLAPNGNGSGLTSLTAGNIAAGNLGANVIASSVAVGSVYDNAIAGMSSSKLTGALPAIDGSALTGVTATNVTAAGVQAGSLGASVIASSIAVNGVYTNAIQALAVTDAKINDVAGGKITGAGSIVADRIAAGSLGANVIASSIAVNAVQDGSIVGVSGSKVSGNISGNAANITGNLAASQVASGSLGA